GHKEIARSNQNPRQHNHIISLTVISRSRPGGTDKAFGQEGCLSIPDYYADVERYSSVVVSALDRHGNQLTMESSEFLAIVMQHEIDHLDGNLFIDYLSPLKQQMALKKVKKSIKSAS
ncbi:peptide deformylase, partial [Aeromonas salmonicida]|uniref:peptide deformylase n=2 Tax=Aeromonas salmonicida TaxID=645 RepID=UPI0030A41402